MDKLLAWKHQTKNSIRPEVFLSKNTMQGECRTIVSVLLNNLQI